MAFSFSCISLLILLYISKELSPVTSKGVTQKEEERRRRKKKKEERRRRRKKKEEKIWIAELKASELVHLRCENKSSS